MIERFTSWSRGCLTMQGYGSLSDRERRGLWLGLVWLWRAKLIRESAIFHWLSGTLSGAGNMQDAESAALMQADKKLLPLPI